MHETNDTCQRVGVAFGKNAMTEVENVPRSPASPLQNVADAGLNCWPGGQHQRRIEITLDGDAGAKTLTKDVAPYLDGYGAIPAYPDAIIERLSDYHGVVRIPHGTPGPRVGEVVAVVPNHVCPVIDTRDSFIVARAGVPVGRWPVAARGRSG